MTQVDLNCGWYKISIKSTSIEMRSNTIYPTLEFGLRFSVISTDSQQAPATGYVRISNVKGEVFIGGRSIGIAENLNYSWQLRLPDADLGTQIFLKLDHYGLSQIEKIREGKDLNLSINVNFAFIDSQNKAEYYTAVLPMYVAKSDWVEKLLTNVKFKEVFMLEVPKITSVDFSEVLNCLSEAWRQQSMGQPNNVVTECRKALEGLRTKIIESGYSTTEEQKTIPDWKKLFGNENIGDIIGTINKKLTGFFAPGAHFGKELSLVDSYFAIMETHALLYYVISKFENSK